mmetsp:Transcript_63379/g.181850  ORF Transcript_63379/g.181850 Transcript_63379/m.181850 type:complete len:269 (+) Transcript_63379:566-1372(+)
MRWRMGEHGAFRAKRLRRQQPILSESKGSVLIGASVLMNGHPDELGVVPKLLTSMRQRGAPCGQCEHQKLSICTKLFRTNPRPHDGSLEDGPGPLRTSSHFRRREVTHRRTSELAVEAQVALGMQVKLWAVAHGRQDNVAVGADLLAGELDGLALTTLDGLQHDQAVVPRGWRCLAQALPVLRDTFEPRVHKDQSQLRIVVLGREHSVERVAVGENVHVKHQTLHGRCDVVRCLECLLHVADRLRSLGRQSRDHIAGEAANRELDGHG